MSVNRDLENDWEWFPPLRVPLADGDKMIVRRPDGTVYQSKIEDVKVYMDLQNTIFVTEAYQLLDIDSSKNYMLDGVIDMAGQSIPVPSGGLSISGLNGARDTAKLIDSTDNATLFTTPEGSYSGNIVMESMSVEVTGTGSKVFDLDNAENSGAIDVTGVNFNNCTSMGELTDYRQLFFSACGFINPVDGLTLNGTWSGLVATDSIALGSSAFTLFKEGSGLTFSGSIRSNLNFLIVNAASVLMDFQESNILADEGVLLNGFRTTADDAMPNLPGSSVKVKYSDCRGIRNTYIGGQWVMTTPAATPASSPAANTKYKILGDVTYSDLQWFSDGGGENSMEYLSSDPVEVEIKGVFTATGTNGDQINLWIRQWDASASQYIDISSSGQNTLNASGRNEGIPIFGYALVEQGDRLELWGENNAARQFTISTGGLFGVSER